MAQNIRTELLNLQVLAMLKMAAGPLSAWSMMRLIEEVFYSRNKLYHAFISRVLDSLKQKDHIVVAETVDTSRGEVKKSDLYKLKETGEVQLELQVNSLVENPPVDFFMFLDLVRICGWLYPDKAKFLLEGRYERLKQNSEKLYERIKDSRKKTKTSLLEKISLENFAGITSVEGPGTDDEKREAIWPAHDLEWLRQSLKTMNSTEVTLLNNLKSIMERREELGKKVFNYND